MVMPIFISNDLRSHFHPNGPEAVKNEPEAVDAISKVLAA
jgi:hypothetical protein